MRKVLKRVAICALLVLSAWAGAAMANRERITQDAIRFHVVANSDSEEDQKIKLQVRDAVQAYLMEDLKRIRNPEEAKAYLREKLPQIRGIAQKTLRILNSCQGVTVSLSEESFDSRTSGKVSLPAGVYETLRITLGEGAGHNWWCVVFPASGQNAGESVSTAAGFPDTRYADGEIRFALLDVLHRLENIFFGG